MALQRIRQRCVERLVFQATPNAESKAAAGHQYPAHLAQAGGAVWEELQPLMTAHDIESGIGKG